MSSPRQATAQRAARPPGAPTRRGRDHRLHQRRPGRHGRSWSAPPRSQIALSIGVDAADVPPANWGYFPLLTGVALVDAIREATGVEALRGLTMFWSATANPGIPRRGCGPGYRRRPGANVTLTAGEAPDHARHRCRCWVHRTPTATSSDLHLGNSSPHEQWRSAGGRDSELMSDYRHRRRLGAARRSSRVAARSPEQLAIDDLGRLIDTGTETARVSAGDVVHLRPATDYAGAATSHPPNLVGASQIGGVIFVSHHPLHREVDGVSGTAEPRRW